MTRASCATRIAAIRLPCSYAATTVWNGWGQPARWWGCSRNGIARWKNANWDTVLLYTDGVTEALNAEGEQFGEERLLEATRQHRELSPPELLAAVADQARGFSPHEQADDITLIVANCT